MNSVKKLTTMFGFIFSVTAAEYGSVICDAVEMADIPAELQEARVFKLHLRNNGLFRFPDAKLQGTGNFSFQNTYILIHMQLKQQSFSK